MSLKITLGEMRAAGALAVLVYCRACGHGTRLEAERWPDDVRLSDLEPRFTCKACGARGADVRPDYSGGRGEGRATALESTRVYWPYIGHGNWGRS